MKLYMMQHGEAISKHDDPERPLTEKGKSDANRIAVFMRQAGVKVERIIHSGKLRAQQTAERLVNAISPGNKPEVSDMINPNDSAVAFYTHCLGWSGDSLIVGHLPFLEHFVAHLITGNKNAVFTTYTPGTVICLEYHDDNRWTLNWMMSPELLK